MYYALFLICILSRLLYSVYYPEDIDSLRFALSLADGYDVTRFQPHFPGYPVFCFIAYILYSISGSIAVSFSMIGGVSTFLTIYFTGRILDIDIRSKAFAFTCLIILFNPMIALLGTRYMPDLMGLSIAITSIYYIVFSFTDSHKYIGFFLAGILLGIRLSYFPLVITPIALELYRRRARLNAMLCFILGIIVWLIPFLATQGLGNLYSVALKHTIGHMNEYGGTIITEGSLLIRLKMLFYTVWSDGLGGYWEGRSFLTIFNSLSIVFLLSQLIKNSRIVITSKMKVVIVSIAIYALWIFLFQNIIYKSRHVLPVVYLILLVMSATYMHDKSTIHYVLLLFVAIITINLSIDHRKGTAIWHLTNHLHRSQNDVVISNPLVNYYLSSNRIGAEFVSIDSLMFQEDKDFFGRNVKVVGDYSQALSERYELSLDTIFYHNPYMNRMWSAIPLYSIK